METQYYGITSVLYDTKYGETFLSAKNDLLRDHFAGNPEYLRLAFDTKAYTNKEAAKRKCQELNFYEKQGDGTYMKSRYFVFPIAWSDGKKAKYKFTAAQLAKLTH